MARQVFVDPVPLKLKYYADKANLKVGEFWERASPQLLSRDMNGFMYLMSERNWIAATRPFFNVHPSVLTSLARSNLTMAVESIPRSIVDDLQVICVKLPHRNWCGVSHFFLHVGKMVLTSGQTLDRSVGIYFTINGALFTQAFSAGETFEDDSRCQERLDCPATPSLFTVEETKSEAVARKRITRLAIGVLLLAADENYISPVVLKKDKGKPISDEVISRARRRNVFGFDIGAGIELTPHFRRPHFGIRWTGVGSAVPRLVPIKGAFINTETNLLRVPTGYEAGDVDTVSSCG